MAVGHTWVEGFYLEGGGHTPYVFVIPHPNIVSHPVPYPWWGVKKLWRVVAPVYSGTQPHKKQTIIFDTILSRFDMLALMIYL